MMQEDEVFPRKCHILYILYNLHICWVRLRCYRRISWIRWFINNSSHSSFFTFFSFCWFYRGGKGGRKRGRETMTWERNIDWLPPSHTPTGDETCNPGMCPDLELNQRPFALLEFAQPTEPYWSGLPAFSVPALPTLIRGQHLPGWQRPQPSHPVLTSQMYL